MNWLKSLSIYLEPRVLTLLILGFSAGIPLLLVFSTLSFWLTEADINRSEIGMLSWVALAYAVKWVWAPLVDNLKLPILSRLLGRRKSWMLVSQIGILVGLIGMASSDPLQGIWTLVFFALVLSFSSATQDIVIDAYRIDTAPEELQAAMAASYLAGYRIAMIVSGAGALALAAYFSGDDTGYIRQSWSQTYQVMSLLMIPGLLVAVFGKEPKIKKHKPGKVSYHNNALLNFLIWMKKAFVEPITDFFIRYGKHALLLLMLIAIYRMTDVVMGIMANPFYVDIGFTKGEVAAIAKVFGVIMTLVGAAIGGILVSQKGTLFTLFVGALLTASTNLIFVVLSKTGPDLTWLTIVISVDNLSGGIATAAFIAFLSMLTNKDFSATQYAVFSSTMLLLPKFVAGFSGFFVEAFDYTWFFIGCALIGLPALILVAVLAKLNAKHQFLKVKHSE
ncbi:MFS transporter [Catenovulum sp. SM1970]|uniref:AmpG family muropeptide MFS transporter n=1 Tax=Marinifaba aquimaris TaxID=2741323 RepID=UPI0015742A66|nr:MFS transporter [Marinifaba aquimaris]NTS77592.1 MFS transporter [Marinifaba aquimaris]